MRRRARWKIALGEHPLAIALVVTAVATAVRLTGTVDSDVAWQLWIAGRINAGATLYRDIIETNPPLWFWLALPVDWVAHPLGVRPEAALVVAIGGLVAAALWATDTLTDGLLPKGRALIFAYAALILSAMPWAHVGQREQLVLIATLPYAALIAARRQGARVSTWTAVAVGVGTALGFALKHYFILAPLLLEAWLWRSKAPGWRPVRAETTTLAACAALYAAATLVAAPSYLTDILPLLRLAYGATGATTAAALLNPFALVTAGILTTVALGLATRRSDTAFASALLVAALGFAAGYVIQFKGWPYHAIPALGCASIALAVLLTQGAKVPRPLQLAAPALLALPLLLVARESKDPALPNADLREAIAGLGPGDPVAFIASETAVAWSVTLQHQFRYPSRYNGYWMLMAVAANERRPQPDQRLERLWDRVIAETVRDLRCIPPQRIIIARPLPGSGDFDILPMFTRYPAFREMLAHYKPIRRTSFETYQLVTRLEPSLPKECREGV